MLFAEDVRRGVVRRHDRVWNHPILDHDGCRVVLRCEQIPRDNQFEFLPREDALELRRAALKNGFVPLVPKVQPYGGALAITEGEIPRGGVIVLVCCCVVVLLCCYVVVLLCRSREKINRSDFEYDAMAMAMLLC